MGLIMRNPVANVMNRFNKPSTHKNKKKYARKPKHQDYSKLKDLNMDDLKKWQTK